MDNETVETTEQDTDIVSKLGTFVTELEEYRYFALLKANREATRKQVQRANELRDKLLLDVGRFSEVVPIVRTG